MCARRYTTYPRINADFLANLYVTDPTKYKFYGICVDKCPSFRDVICNTDDTVLTATMDNRPTLLGTSTKVALSTISDTNKEQCVSYDNPVPAGVTSCKEINANCWVTPQTTTSIMYRLVVCERACALRSLAD